MSYPEPLRTNPRPGKAAEPSPAPQPPKPAAPPPERRPSQHDDGELATTGAPQKKCSVKFQNTGHACSAAPGVSK